jgi:hypothetical protein
MTLPTKIEGDHFDDFNSNIKLSNINQHGHVSLQTTYNCSKSPSHAESVSKDMYISDLENLENKNFSSSYSGKEMEGDFIPYSSNHFNFDILNCEKEMKNDEGLYGGSFMWNFEDYFSI